MGMKNITKSKSVILWHLLEKRNWAILTSVILIVTVFILPLLLEVDINENIIMVGLVEVFIIGFFSTLLDFNYLHETRKFGYYLSKPYSKIQRLNMTLLINILFSGFFIFVLWLLSVAMIRESTQFFLPFTGMYVTILFLIGLSSVLSGNTLIAAIATWYNFALPLMILGVMYFAVDILSEFAVGFSTSALMDYIVSEYYRMDIIYFGYFYDTVHPLLIFAYLIPLLSGIYLITLWALKKRKNERIGDHLVFRGYQYFVAMIASLIIPFIFTNLMPHGSVVTKLIAFVLLASITYYVAIVILEKTFKLRKQQMVVLAVFLAAFILFVLILGVLVKQHENNIPKQEEIHAVIITNSNWFYDYEKDMDYRLNDIDSDMAYLDGVMVFKSEEGIKVIRELHQSILENPSYYSYVNINVIYELKNGHKTRRYFQLEPYDSTINFRLDEIANQLINVEEYHYQRAPLVYNEDYQKRFINQRMQINTNNNSYYVLATEEVMRNLVENLRKDIDSHSESAEITLQDLVYNWYSPYAIGMKEGEEFANYVSLSFGDEKFRSEYVDIPGNFINTRAYLESLIQ